MGELNPVVMIDSENDRIWFALHRSTLEKCLTGTSKLAENAKFQAAIKGLPTEGNALLFTSKKLCKALVTIPRKSLSGNQKSTPEATAFYDQLTECVTRSETGYAWSIANLNDGILVVCNSPLADKGYSSSSTLAVTTVGVPVLFIGANIYKKGADRAACTMNIRKIQTAVRAHQKDNGLKPGDPISTKDIFGSQKYFSTVPTCPLGDYYTFKTKIPKVGEAIAGCDHADHNPKDTGGW